RGANASFELYEDSGDSYDYEKGQKATIPIRWDERSGVLTLGARQGEFPGMPEKMTFHIVWVRESQGVGMPPVKQPDETLTYTGESVTVQKR
ncbi:MAG: DUF5110 domain-containing protein, partial [Terriglobia bacterium]